MRDAILQASVQTVIEHGLSGWTVDAVASRAGCAKGLVPYHHGSKPQLLRATAKALAARHGEVRHAALVGHRASGTAALDSLWDALAGEVRSGEFAAWTAVWSDPALRSATVDGGAGLESELASLVGRALGVPVAELPPADAIVAVLDGCQTRLWHGAAEADVRSAYERLWLSLIS